VKASRQEGFRARSAFKLLQLVELSSPLQQALVRPQAHVLDIGAAPGSWSQAVKRLNQSAKIVAVDLLPMQPLPGVIVLQQDFLKLLSTASTKLPLCYEVILSDACCNISGNAITDNARNMELWDSIANFSLAKLGSNGVLVMKTFDSNESRSLVNRLRSAFLSVKLLKPEATRTISSERYIVCSQKRN
jgi:23S rRNA (uridine2552-2'-O)-methyltransferase